MKCINCDCNLVVIRCNRYVLYVHERITLRDGITEVRHGTKCKCRNPDYVKPIQKLDTIKNR